jgi:hypothetical protein
MSKVKTLGTLEITEGANGDVFAKVDGCKRVQLSRKQGIEALSLLATAMTGLPEEVPNEAA